MPFSTNGEILVIGATGRTGSEMVRQLRAADISTCALVRNPDRAKSLENLGVRLIEGDLARQDSVETALDGIKGVCLAAPNTPSQISWYENVFDAAKTIGEIRIVKISGFTASLTAPALGHRIHGQTDEMLRQSGLPFTILRPNVFFQNMFLMAGDIRQNGKFSRPAGNAPISMIDICDIAAAACASLASDDHLGKTYDLTGPEALTYRDAADILSGLLGRTVEYIPVSVDEAVAKLVMAGMVEEEAKQRAETMRQFATGAYAPITEDLPSLLDRPPRRFEQFAADHLDRFR